MPADRDDGVKVEWVGYPLRPVPGGWRRADAHAVAIWNDMHDRLPSGIRHPDLLGPGEWLTGSSLPALVTAEALSDRKDEAQARFIAALFRAYYLERRDVGNWDVIKTVAAQCGIDWAWLGQVIQSDAFDHFYEKWQSAIAWGVTEVPTIFLANAGQRLVLKGRTDPGELKRLWDWTRHLR